MKKTPSIVRLVLVPLLFTCFQILMFWKITFITEHLWNTKYRRVYADKLKIRIYVIFMKN